MSALLPALQRLDDRLTGALRAAREQVSVDAALLPYRGLFVGEGEADALLARAPGASWLWSDDGEPFEPDAATPLGWLALAFGLGGLEVDIVLLALAPEVDSRYGRLFAFLQEDVTRRRPTVGLALDLLCATPEDRRAGRRCFAADAPLIEDGLLRREGDAAAPRLSDALVLDEQVAALLLDDGGLDSRLAGFCVLLEAPGGTGLAPPLARLLRAAVDDRRPLRLCLTGPASRAKRETAEAMAAQAGMALLVADLGRADAGAMPVLVRETLLQHALLFVDACDGADTAVRDALFAALAPFRGIAVLAAAKAPPPRPLDGAHGIVPIAVPAPDAAERAATWSAGLAAAGVAAEDADLRALGQRFRLTRDQIVDATAGLPAWAARRGGSDPTLADAYAAARAQTAHRLADVATHVECLAGWDDIVLPADVVTQLRELCARVTRAEVVLNEWGFARKLTRGRGVTALFAGAPGTGKTLAAEIVAGELGLDLFRIDMAGVVSKYIGETEKNLDRIFAAAEDANAVLLFDEADAIFGKRSEVHDSHDRYANLEVSYLLQKMEAFAGIAILATNLRQNLDDAFARRLSFTVHFPFPDDAARRRIWASAWTVETPVDDEVDPDVLAGLVLSGGNIRNAALAAAFLAAEEGAAVGMDHLARALRREYAKLGKGVSDETVRDLLAERVAT